MRAFPASASASASGVVPVAGGQRRVGVRARLLRPRRGCCAVTARLLRELVTIVGHYAQRGDAEPDHVGGGEHVVENHHGEDDGDELLENAQHRQAQAARQVHEAVLRHEEQEDQNGHRAEAGHGLRPVVRAHVHIPELLRLEDEHHGREEDRSRGRDAHDHGDGRLVVVSVLRFPSVRLHRVHNLQLWLRAAHPGVGVGGGTPNPGPWSDGSLVPTVLLLLQAVLLEHAQILIARRHLHVPIQLRRTIRRRVAVLLLVGRRRVLHEHLAQRPAEAGGGAGAQREQDAQHGVRVTRRFLVAGGAHHDAKHYDENAADEQHAGVLDAEEQREEEREGWHGSLEHRIEAHGEVVQRGARRGHVEGRAESDGQNAADELPPRDGRDLKARHAAQCKRDGRHGRVVHERHEAGHVETAAEQPLVREGDADAHGVPRQRRPEQDPERAALLHLRRALDPHGHAGARALGRRVLALTPRPNARPKPNPNRDF
mmetsp:Transcript_16061/g.49070  ORF Transcript_16061/g.49070 Transcript_16061/m.49070 type:complete len:486 (-) Transcript_16061:109-1566(-)